LNDRSVITLHHQSHKAKPHPGQRHRSLRRGGGDAFGLTRPGEELMTMQMEELVNYDPAKLYKAEATESEVQLSSSSWAERLTVHQGEEGELVIQIHSYWDDSVNKDAEDWGIVLADIGRAIAQFLAAKGHEEDVGTARANLIAGFNSGKTFLTEAGPWRFAPANNEKRPETIPDDNSLLIVRQINCDDDPQPAGITPASFSPIGQTLIVESEDMFDYAEQWGTFLADIARSVVRDNPDMPTYPEDKDVLAAMADGFNEALREGDSYYHPLTLAEQSQPPATESPSEANKPDAA
jgi:hypothetical protein